MIGIGFEQNWHYQKMSEYLFIPVEIQQKATLCLLPKQKSVYEKGPITNGLIMDDNFRSKANFTRT